MAEEGQIIVPHVVVDRAEYTEVLKRLDEIDEKVEFVNSEIYQRIGKKVGRDIGILYGITAGIVIILAYAILTGIV
ncbi:MAG: tetrahydromethanopterin S-methyltransferase subunit G [Methanosarcinales archaeon]|jgi:tetrahydromethanopterin S-methyltransferase subunit G|nr:tetrahydromethanopterin S-methyltransferase subunit G [Methanosarcinales archaeon]